MSSRKSPWWQLVFITIFVMVVLGLLIVGWFRTESLGARLFVAAFLLLCASLVAYSTIHDWRQDRRLRLMLAGRELVDPESFGTRHFSHLPRGPMVAAAVRQLLDEHLEMDLGGLRPDDKLDYLIDWIDPLFVDELATRLDFPPPKDWEEYCRLMEPLKTMGDFIAALASRTGPTPR